MKVSYDEFRMKTYEHTVKRVAAENEQLRRVILTLSTEPSATVSQLTETLSGERLKSAEDLLVRVGNYLSTASGDYRVIDRLGGDIGAYFRRYSKK